MAENTHDGSLSRIGRPVRVTSISFAGKTLQEIAPLVDQEGARGADPSSDQAAGDPASGPQLIPGDPSPSWLGSTVRRIRGLGQR